MIRSFLKKRENTYKMFGKVDVGHDIRESRKK
jgi:hypothetical protein